MHQNKPQEVSDHFMKCFDLMFTESFLLLFSVQQVCFHVIQPQGANSGLLPFNPLILVGLKENKREMRKVAVMRLEAEKRLRRVKLCCCFE